MSLETIPMKLALLDENMGVAVGYIAGAAAIFLRELNLAFEKFVPEDLIISDERSVKRSRHSCALAMATEAGEATEVG